MAKLAEWTCDELTCMRRVYSPPNKPPETGYHGTIVEAETGVTAEWYACQFAHIQDAIVEALERARAESE